MLSKIGLVKFFFMILLSMAAVNNIFAEIPEIPTHQVLAEMQLAKLQLATQQFYQQIQQQIASLQQQNKQYQLQLRELNQQLDVLQQQLQQQRKAAPLFTLTWLQNHLHQFNPFIVLSIAGVFLLLVTMMLLSKQHLSAVQILAHDVPAQNDELCPVNNQKEQFNFVKDEVDESKNSVSSQSDNQDSYDFINSVEGIPAKIDLARIYIDMGNYSTAKIKLAEVIAKGDQVYQQQAQSLLDEIRDK